MSPCESMPPTADEKRVTTDRGHPGPRDGRLRMKKGGREEVFELGLERTALLKSIPENRFDPKHQWRFDVAGRTPRRRRDRRHQSP